MFVSNISFLNLGACADLNRTTVSYLQCFTSNDIFLINKGYICYFGCVTSIIALTNDTQLYSVMPCTEEVEELP